MKAQQGFMYKARPCWTGSIQAGERKSKKPFRQYLEEDDLLGPCWLLNMISCQETSAALFSSLTNQHYGSLHIGTFTSSPRLSCSCWIWWQTIFKTWKDTWHVSHEKPKKEKNQTILGLGVGFNLVLKVQTASSLFLLIILNFTTGPTGLDLDESEYLLTRPWSSKGGQRKYKAMNYRNLNDISQVPSQEGLSNGLVQRWAGVFCFHFCSPYLSSQALDSYTDRFRLSTPWHVWFFFFFFRDFVNNWFSPDLCPE